MSEDLMTVFEKMEKLLVIQRWIISLTAAAVLWGARLEWSNKDHEQRLNEVEADNKQDAKNISEIQGRLHGIASQLGKLPGQVAAKVKEDFEP
jgi:hypothetical protein